MGMSIGLMSYKNELEPGAKASSSRGDHAKLRGFFTEVG